MAEYIERESVCYRLAKQATIDGQPRAIKRAAKIVADFPAADVCPYYVGNKHDRGDDSLCRKAECEVKAVRPIKRGKWVKAEVQPYFRKHYNVEVCSVCQYRKSGKWNYCPNCGADMRGTNDEKA